MALGIARLLQWYPALQEGYQRSGEDEAIAQALQDFRADVQRLTEIMQRRYDAGEPETTLLENALCELLRCRKRLPELSTSSR